MSVKSDLNNTYLQEYIEYNRLFLLGSTRTSTCQLSYTSPSSTITYTTTGSAYDNQGQTGMMSLLKSALSSYMITSSDWNNMETLVTTGIATALTQTRIQLAIKSLGGI